MHKKTQGSNRNHKAVISLLGLGFPHSRVRRILPKLTGITHQEVAEQLEYERSVITRLICSGGGHRLAKKAVAEIYGVPAELMFPPDEAA